MQLHRLAWTLGATSLLLLGAYACGGDDDDNGIDETPDGGNADTGVIGTLDSGNNGPETGSPVDAGDAGEDSGIGFLCTGNPLSPDGGIAETSQDGGVYSIASGEFPYGPQYVDENGGQVLFTEFNNHTVVYVGPDGGTGKTTLIPQAVDSVNYNQSDYAGGNVYTAMAVTNGGGQLLMTALDGGAPVTIATWTAAQINSPNGIAVGRNGIGYVTDPGFQKSQVTTPPTGIYSVKMSDGTLTAVENAGQPVGIALNADQTRLYVSYANRAVKYWTVDPATGALSAPTTFAKTTKFNPGGIAIDQGGNVWVAEYDGENGQRGVIEVFNSAGSRIWGTVFIPGRRPNGIAFGGADRTKVFVTTDSNEGTSDVYSFSTRCPGTL